MSFQDRVIGRLWSSYHKLKKQLHIDYSWYFHHQTPINSSEGLGLELSEATNRKGKALIIKPEDTISKQLWLPYSIVFP